MSWDGYGFDLQDERRATSVKSVPSKMLTWVHDDFTGCEYALLQVEPMSGLWVVRSRFPSGCFVDRHLHSGPVAAVTLDGNWGYPDADVTCEPGDFLVESAGTMHRLEVNGPHAADIVFSIWGSVTYFDSGGDVLRIEDWRSVLDEYAEGCKTLDAPMRVIGVTDGTGSRY